MSWIGPWPVALMGWIVLSGLACHAQEVAPPRGVSGRPDSLPPLAEPPPPAHEAVASALAEVLEKGRHPWLRWPALADVLPALRELYTGEADGLFWYAGDQPYPALAGAVSALAGAAGHGLSPVDYDAERIETESKRLEATPGASARDRALFDLAVSVGVLRVMEACHSGRVHPRALGWGFDVEPQGLARAARLREARESSGVPALLDGLEPAFPHYGRNRQTLSTYRAWAAAGEPAPVPALPKDRRKVEPGQPWDGVAVLSARLRLFGDLADAPPPATAPDGTPLYEGALVDAVRRFQSRHVLDPDGIVGAATIEAVNVPLAHRVRQLELAMERGRWLPRLDDRPSVFVNVPLYRLWASDPVRGLEPLRMKVVVGKSMNHRTPIFVEQVEYIVFRPYWNPPYSIASREIVPKARRDPSYLEREDLEIVASGDEGAPALPATPENLDAIVAGRLHVRQRPGPRNSLGLAKFIFPNDANVYMHGTPAPQLFARTRRDFSHGCIRLEDPAALAAWALRHEPSWSRARIDAAMRAERPQRVNLKEPLRVVLFYDTVHVNSDGVVHFAEDIYGHDRALDQALSRGYPYPHR